MLNQGVGRMYGSDRIRELAFGQDGSQPDDLIETYLKVLAAFRKDVPAGDDLTIMTICRSPGSRVRAR